MPKSVNGLQKCSRGEPRGGEATCLLCLATTSKAGLEPVVSAVNDFKLSRNRIKCMLAKMLEVCKAFFVSPSIDRYDDVERVRY
mmetsp:Transcript_2622/g.10958  ORF Transcript_2622/g.10958 Transcript_2622/m.10958 type:complete len:84 (+) Transcript_2622:183-434(+)